MIILKVMLDNKTIQKIKDFVSKKPRSINEVAKHLDKSWRTVDRYLEEIKKEYGIIETRTFRGGTRGALKLVYMTPTENFSGTIYQEELEKRIYKGRYKTDISSFDIYQFVESKDKKVWTKKGLDESDAGRLIEFAKVLENATKQILFFSGNLSFINFKDKTTNIFEILETLVKNGISIKVLCNVDFHGLKNIKKLLALNYKYGVSLIEIKHREQPLRATIVDDKLINLKDFRDKTLRKKEFKEKLFIFYEISNKDWIKWLTRIFWSIFNKSISAEKRIEELDKILI